MHRWQRIWSAVFATVALAAAAGGCSDSSAPDPSEPSQPGDIKLESGQTINIKSMIRK
jgi:hypothetical protein